MIFKAIDLINRTLSIGSSQAQNGNAKIISWHSILGINCGLLGLKVTAAAVMIPTSDSKIEFLTLDLERLFLLGSSCKSKMETEKTLNNPNTTTLKINNLSHL